MSGEARLTAIIAIVSLAISFGLSEDLPCRRRDVGIEGRSVVCVCDSEYCDTITREEPAPGTFVAYTSSNAGQRFEKSYGVVQTNLAGEEGEVDSDEDPDYEPVKVDADDDLTNISDDEDESIYEDGGRNLGDIIDNLLNDVVVLRIFANTRHQFIEGFGGSVTDAASINWRKLSDTVQTRLIRTYFGADGIEYNLIRVPIGGCDFSTHPYTYNEMPWNDKALTNYSLAPEDLFYKLPMIKRSQQLATDEIKITASTWSPPIWMKTNERITGFGQLKPEFYQSYADYHIKFLEEYEKAEVKIWAITTTNEPINGIIPIARFNSLGWTPSQLGHWVADNLGPTVRQSRFNSTLILAVDDQRYTLSIWLGGMERANPKSIDYIDGIAVHYYGNFFPASSLSMLQRRYEGKILLSTEACEGAMPWVKEKVAIGSWRRARRYATSIMQDLNHFVVGWIDWNLCLDPNGGPNWANNFVDSPILVYGDRNEFIKQPMFYAMGHFSKFIPRNSRRIQVSRRSILSLENVAVIKPNGNIVIVLQNRRTRVITARIRFSRTQFIELQVEPESLKTIEVNLNN